MPRVIRMSWEPSRRRWWKVINGKRYVVSVRQLKKLGYLPLAADESKEATYQSANAWLENQLKAEPFTPFSELLGILEARKQWANQHGQDTSGIDFTKHLSQMMAEDGR